MFRFESPLYFLGLLAIIPLAWLWKDFSQWYKNAVTQWGNSSFLTNINQNATLFNQQGYRYLAILGLCCIALANPQWGTGDQKGKKQGADVLVCLDISQSMWAEDVNPNRMTKAKLLIQRMVEKMKGDRVGVVVFAGDAFLEIPMTNDYGAVKLFLKSISPDITSVQGTAIDKALETARVTLDKKVGKGKSKAILIISDGEDHEGSPEKEAQKCSEQGIKIFTLGIGSTKGAHIPLQENGSPAGMMMDRSGNLVVSALNEQILKDLAKIGGGNYLHFSSEVSDAKKLLAQFSKIGKNEYDDISSNRYESHFIYLLILAFGIWLWECFRLKK